ncbi:MAG: GntR family transcriptional regulator [Rhodospirillales bacterium]
MNETRDHAIVRALRSAIIEQAISPGTRLPEDMIGERFGVSRTIVRSALGQLASEGLVEQRRNRGAIVAEPSWNEARDTFDLRLALEELVVSRLAGALHPDQIAALDAHVDEEDRAQNLDEPHSIRLAGEFHVMLAEFTGSEVLTQYMRELASRCCLMLALYSRPHSSECGVTEHRELVELLKRGNQHELVRAMRQHLGGVIERALIHPPKREDRDIGDILTAYASD